MSYAGDYIWREGESGDRARSQVFIFVYISRYMRGKGSYSLFTEIENEKVGHNENGDDNLG